MSNKNKTITAISGVAVGHVTDEQNATGVTVVRFADDGACAAVSVQGAAPGTRETDLLEPGNLVDRVHAIVLTGGSAFGLDAASGVMAVLDEEGQGLGVLPDVVVPIVPAAVLFDLSLGSSSVRPSAEWGRRAASDVSTDPVQSGNIGAGTGATVGKLAGPASATKGGLGSASLTLPNGVTVAALVAVNAVGEIVDSATGTVIAGVRGSEKGAYRSSVDIAMGLSDAEGPIGSNTTIGIVVTDAPLSKADLKKVAEMAHDGFARAIRPVHTQFDGDTLFAVSTATHDENVKTASHSGAILNSIGVAAAKVVEMAIIDGVTAAESLVGCVASQDW